MHMACIKISGRGAVYHGILQVVGGKRLFGDLEKKKFRQMLWQQAAFSGLEVITSGLLSNHLHLLLRVPGEAAVTDAEPVERGGSVKLGGAPDARPAAVGQFGFQTGKLDEPPMDTDEHR